MNFIKLLILIGLLIMSSTSINAADNRIVCQANKVCRDTLTQQPLRVLPKALSHVYTHANTRKVKVSNIQAFYPLFAFERKNVDVSNPTNPQGWYQIGLTPQKPLGWMRAKDVIEWKHALIVSYTHPGSGEDKRKPVVWFKTKADVKNIMESDDYEETILELYQKLDQQQFPNNVIVTEPKKYLDIFEDFYIIPVIDFEQIDLDGDDALYVELIAAHPTQRGGQGKQADTVANPDYVKQISASGDRLSQAQAQKLGIDVVFLLDMTRSMGPYMEEAKQLVHDIVSQLNKKIQDKIKFGLVGYRDSVKHMSGIGFTAKNFTPNMVGAHTLKTILDTKAKATTVDSIDYAEEMFAGMELALNSNWREDTLRFLCLIGDASSHPVGNPYSTTGKDQQVLRQDAIERGIHITAIHLKIPRHFQDHAAAEEQFLALSKIQGDKEDSSAFVQVNTRDANRAKAKGLPSDYDKAVSVFVDSIGLILEKTQNVPSQGIDIDEVTDVTSDTVAQEPDNLVVQQADFAIKSIAKAALIEYVGKEQNPPKDIQGWALDRDMVDPSSPALRVHVLLTKAQLNTLATSVQNIIQALEYDEISRIGFFKALQKVALQTSQNPGNLGKEALRDTIVPKFLEALPYKSKIAEMNDELYEQLTPDERIKLLRSLKAKRIQYIAINASPAKWIDPTDEKDPDTMFFPLSLGLLP
jgi:hypothetical protein